MDVAYLFSIYLFGSEYIDIILNDIETVQLISQLCQIASK